MSEFSLTFALRLLGRTYEHTVNATVGFALIIAIIISTSGIITGFGATIFGLTEQAGYSNRFTIRSKEIDGTLPYSLFEELETSSFSVVLPLIKVWTNFTDGNKLLQTELVGTQLEDLEEVFSDSSLFEGKMPEANDSRTIKESLRGIEIRGILNISSLWSYNTSDGYFGELEVVGTITGVAELQQTVIIAIEDYADIVNKSVNELSLSEIKILTKRTMTESEIKEKLQSLLGGDFQLIDVWNEQQADIFAQKLLNDVYEKLVIVFIVLSIIALIRLFHSISWFTLNYERSFLIMRAIGISRGGLFTMMTIIGIIVGNLGFILGVFIGYITPPLILSLMTGFLGMSFLVTNFPISDLPILWILSMIITIMATVGPAVKIMRTPPAKISMLIRER